MSRFVLVIVVLISLVAVAEASASCSGYVHSLDEINVKIAQLKDLILLNFLKSGFTMWVPFYYWVSDDGEKIFYCYSLVPLGRKDPLFADQVSKYCIDCGSEPVYVPIKINRGAIAKS